MQWYDEIIQILLIGIANGAIIALIALGYTLVYGIIELINFAHGDVFMIGTMVSLTHAHLGAEPARRATGAPAAAGDAHRAARRRRADRFDRASARC